MLLCINFKLRLSKKTNRERPVKIYARIRIDGITAPDFTTGVSVLPEKWDSKSQRIKGSSRQVQEDNSTLDNVRTDIKEIFNTLRLLGHPCTAPIVRAHYLKGNEYSPTLLVTYQKFLDKLEENQGSEDGLENATISKWYTCKDHLMDFIKQEFRRSDVALNEITVIKADNFYSYLKVVKEHGLDHAAKNMQNLSRVLDFADETHLALLSKKEFTGTLEAVVDCFLFQCYTGMAYAELFSFNPDHHIQTYCDEPIIRIVRKKRKKKNPDVCLIPILPQTRALLNKYPDGLPIFDIHTMNRHLHVLEPILKVDFSITTHVGRKTAGMFLLNNGVSLETVSRILGHSSITTTQRHYVKVLEKRVLKETAHLR
ncbi:hypothetical protein BWI96_17290 [Siphonobacter sp. SORGH_AS_0500]|uniref:site-specific integrase n=1 Tax=Siphonobacter sp. SORGH_AS_0500 TaxID=1864824 RepID=UPI000CB13540|nr:site-specific integrase [Siphonobacter sp. SORGH_AS_0500]PKK35291.1 hypothetical protein BWI96_17290 [Siphonobacter sp. SORGH_AS_0500]